jgi:Zn-finger nucleic acid-binding protein
MEPDVVHPLRCGRCGGSFQEGHAACPYCGAGIALEDRGRSALCPRCSVRAPVGASWCPSCGDRLVPQSLAPVTEGRGCPACKSPLRERVCGERSLTECSSCGGLWLAASVLDELCSAAERSAIASTSPLAARPPRPRPPPEQDITYRPCPGCGDLMSRRQFGGSSHVVVDVCRKHGIWLDPQELERVLEWVRSGGAERERRLRIEREARSRPVDPRRAPTPPLGSPRDHTLEAEMGWGLLEAISWLVKSLR